MVIDLCRGECRLRFRKNRSYPNEDVIVLECSFGVKERHESQALRRWQGNAATQ